MLEQRDEFDVFCESLADSIVEEFIWQLRGGVPGDSLWVDWAGNLFWAGPEQAWPDEAACLALADVDMAEVIGGEWIDVGGPNGGRRVVVVPPGPFQWHPLDISTEESARWAASAWITNNLPEIACDTWQEYLRVVLERKDSAAESRRMRDEASW